MPIKFKYISFSILASLALCTQPPTISAQSFSSIFNQSQTPRDRVQANTITIGLLKGQNDFSELLTNLQNGKLQIGNSIYSRKSFTVNEYSDSWISISFRNSSNRFSGAVQNVIFRFFENDTDLLRAMHFGQVDQAVLNDSRLVKLMIPNPSRDGLAPLPVRFLSNTVDMLIYNLNHPVLKNPEIRKAISYSIKKKKIEEDILEGQGLAAEGSPYDSESSFFPGKEGIEEYRYSSKKAVNILRKEGWVQSEDFIYYKDGLPASFRLYFKKGIQLELKIATQIKRDLNLRGMQVQLIAMTVDEMMEKMESGDYDAVLWQHRFEERDFAVYDFFVNPETSFLKIKDAYFERAYNRMLTLPAENKKAAIDHLQIITNQKCFATYLTFRWWQFYVFNNATVTNYYDVTIKPIDEWRVLKQGK